MRGDSCGSRGSPSVFLTCACALGVARRERRAVIFWFSCRALGFRITLTLLHGISGAGGVSVGGLG